MKKTSIQKSNIMRISFILAILLLSFLQTVQSQTLSSDYHDPDLLLLNQEIHYSTFALVQGESTELGVPECSRDYTNRNYYARFLQSYQSAVQVIARFDNQTRFGMALYLVDGEQYHELRCDIFDSSEASLIMTTAENPEGLDVIVRLWVLDDVIPQQVGLCALLVSDPPGEPKLMTVNTTTYTVSQLVTDVLVTGCLQASNVTFQGGATSIGYFSNATPGLDFAEGIVMSTGSVLDAPGPNSSGSTSTITNSGSDPQLQTLMPGYTINDATVLQFDFVPASDQLEFQYVFGSEEYMEWVGLGFNDVFAFFLSGPNPSGGNYNNVNIALIPNTSIPVTIDNVNLNTNSQYYVNGSSYIEYDGYTVTLTAQADVVQCANYHIKLAVGDCGDSSYDSAVFLKAGSFTSGESYTMQAFNAWGSALHFYEGCSNYLVFTRTENTNINEPVPIVLTIGGTATQGVDYTAIPTNLEIPAGQQTYTYYIDALFDGVAEGTETITFTFMNGCPCSTSSSTTTIYIDDQFAITPSLTNNGPICVGDQATIDLTLNMSGVNSEVQIIWSTGASDVSSITVQPTATQTYTATIIYPCDTMYASTTVQVINPPIVDLGPDFEITGFTAPLDADMPSGNTGIWSYVTGSGPGTVTIGSPTNPHTIGTVSEFGTYTYTWTETSLAPNCVSSDDIAITYFHIPTTDFYITPVLCFGDTAVITYTGNGFDWATYNWDFDGATVLSGTGWGPYQVVWDYHGLHNVSLAITELNVTVDTVISVYVPPILDYEFTYSDDPCYHSCNGYAQVDVTGGTPPYEYHWGSSTNIMNHLCAGQYIITVDDVNGCSFTQQFTINEPTQMTFDTAYQNVDCFGNHTGWATVTANGGTPPYTYIWSDMFNGATHNDLAAGIYTVTIYDSNNCSLFEQFHITQPGLLQIATSPSLAICENTSIQISAQQIGGVQPYTYHWNTGSGFSNGPPSFEITPHQDVTYQVYITDGHNCQTPTNTIAITVSPTMSYELAFQNVSCNGVCDGHAEITVLGGIPPFSYSWASANHIYNNLCAGLYVLTVTDEIGCNVHTHFVITEPEQLEAYTTSSPANCFNSNDGQAVVHVSGGTLPYTYLWPDFSNTNVMVNGAGSYVVTVIDAHNCRVEATTTITSPPLLVVQAIPDQVICHGGEATVSAQSAGGNGYTQFLWQGSDGSEYHTHLFHATPEATTTYALTVTDENGCTAAESVMVTVLPDLSIESIIANTDSICAGDSVIITLHATGGNGGPYTLTLQNGITVPSPYKVFPEETTTYYFTLSDDCESPTVTDSVTIYVMPAPENEFIVDKISGCEGDMFIFTETHENDGNTYSWNFGDGNFADIQNPYHIYQDPGIYSVSLTITNEFNCKTSVVISDAVEIFNKPEANFIATPEETTILNPLISFTNLSEDATYLFWFYGDGDSTVYIHNPQHFYSETGEFQVQLVVENIHGCADTVYRTVNIIGEVTIYAPEAFTPNGDGINDCFRLCGTMIDPYSFNMTVYDRWGERVFETDEYRTDVSCNACTSDSWDGTRGSRVAGDKYLPMGLYYWYAEFRDIIGIKHEVSGMVRLIR